MKTEITQGGKSYASRALTERQKAFVEAYMTPGRGFANATRAARIAGYRWPSRQGPALTHHPAVYAAIEAIFQPMLAEAGRDTYT